MIRDPLRADPARRDGQAHHRTPDDMAGRFAHPHARQGDGDGHEPEAHGHDPSISGEDRLQRAECTLQHRAVGHVGKQRHAQLRQRPRQRHIGRKAHDEHDHERPQVAAAQPRQRAEAAIARQRHAIAEHQPADHCAQRVPLDVEIGTCPRVEQPGPDRGLCADDRNPDRDRPHPQPPVIRGIKRVFDRAQGAEPAHPRRKAQQNTAQQAYQRGCVGLSDDVQHVVLPTGRWRGARLSPLTCRTGRRRLQ